MVPSILLTPVKHKQKLQFIIPMGAQSSLGESAIGGCKMSGNFRISPVDRLVHVARVSNSSGQRRRRAGSRFSVSRTLETVARYCAARTFVHPSFIKKIAATSSGSSGEAYGMRLVKPLKNPALHRIDRPLELDVKVLRRAVGQVAAQAATHAVALDRDKGRRNGAGTRSCLC
jgi:hypothetical protein